MHSRKCKGQCSCLERHACACLPEQALEGTCLHWKWGQEGELNELCYTQHTQAAMPTRVPGGEMLGQGMHGRVGGGVVKARQGGKSGGGVGRGSEWRFMPVYSAKSKTGRK